MGLSEGEPSRPRDRIMHRMTRRPSCAEGGSVALEVFGAPDSPSRYMQRYKLSLVAIPIFRAQTLLDFASESSVLHNGDDGTDGTTTARWCAADVARFSDFSGRDKVERVFLGAR